MGVLGRFDTSARIGSDIHSALQSLESSKPTAHNAVVLQRDGRSDLSQTRTLQKHSCREPNTLPRYSTKAESGDKTFPESQRSPFSASSACAESATKIW